MRACGNPVPNYGTTRFLWRPMNATGACCVRAGLLGLLGLQARAQAGRRHGVHEEGRGALLGPAGPAVGRHQIIILCPTARRRLDEACVSEAVWQSHHPWMANLPARGLGGRHPILLTKPPSGDDLVADRRRVKVPRPSKPALRSWQCDGAPLTRSLFRRRA